jgi:phage FluMu protein Com
MAILNIFRKEIAIICPYCNGILEEPPKTKKKCPNCKNPVYFKVDPYTNKKYYLTEQEVSKIENLQIRYRIEERFYNLFKEYGLKEQYFKKRQADYSEKAKVYYSAFAFINSIFNELKLSHAKKNDFQNLKCMYHSMAYFLHGYNIDNEHNHDFFPYLYESRKMELYDYKSQGKQLGFKGKVEIMTSGKEHSCKKCYELKGKKLTIDEALEKMPIPVKDCENGFCNCDYNLIVD